MALKIEAVLGGDGTGFFRMMTKAEQSAKRFGASALGALKGQIAAVFTVGAIEELSRKTVEFASHMRDLSDRLNVNVEWLQEMQAVLRQNGTDADALAKTMAFLTRARAASQGAGGEKFQAGFAKFGFSTSDVQHMPIQQMIDQIAKAFEHGNQQELIPAFAAIGGKGAVELITAFTENIEKQRAAIRGDIIPEDLIDQLDELGDAFSIFKTKVLSEFAPVLLTFVKQLTTLFSAFKVGAVGAMSFLKSMAGMQGGEFGNPVRAGSEAIQDAFFKATEEVASGAADDEAMRRRHERRHARENAPLNIEPIIPATATKAARGLSPGSDALSAVGNFLGSGLGNAISRIGERTNQLLTDNNKILSNMNRNLATLAEGEDL